MHGIRLRSLERLAPTAALEMVVKDLGHAAQELVLAGCDCANTLQEGLLQPSSLSEFPLSVMPAPEFSEA